MNPTAEISDEELTTLDNDAADDGDDLEASIPDLEEKLLESEAQLTAGCRTFTTDEIREEIWRRYRDATQNYDAVGGEK